LPGAKPALVTYRFFADNIRVPIGVKVMSINPASILIKLEYLKRKDVPVHLQLRGHLPEGYQLIKAEVRPDMIRIKGAESQVSEINEIPTLPLELSALSGNLEREAFLDLSRVHAQLDSPVPKVVIHVQPMLESFKIKNVEVQVRASSRFHLEERSITIFVKASAKEIQSLDRAQVYAAVELTGKEKGKYYVPIRVTLPKNMELVKSVPDHVNVTLF
jgi:YbbR domain-containing protein